MNIEFNREEHSQYKDIPLTRGSLDISPRDAGFDSERLTFLENHFLGLIDKKRIQSAFWLLARKGEIFSWAGAGKQDFRNDKAMDPQAVRWIASITKLLTTIAILQLYEQGRLDIFASVSELIKEFDNDTHRPITMAHLMTHTSGIMADGGFFQEPYPHPWIRSKQSWIKSVLEGPLQSPPGEVWSYCTKGFVVLGEIIQRVSSMSYEEYIHEHIFKPLKMEDSCFKIAKSNMDRMCFAGNYEIKHLRDSDRKDPFNSPPPSGGGAYSSLYDLYRLGQCLLNDGELDGKRIISRKAIEMMRTNQLSGVSSFAWGTKVKEYSYGMGTVIHKDMFSSSTTFGHEGAGASAFFVDKDHELVYVFFVPYDSDWVPEAVDNPRAIIHSGILST